MPRMPPPIRLWGKEKGHKEIESPPPHRRWRNGQDGQDGQTDGARGGPAAPDFWKRCPIVWANDASPRRRFRTTDLPRLQRETAPRKVLLREIFPFSQLSYLKVNANLQSATPSEAILHQLPVLCFKNF